jgi:hypothetical protein
MFNRSRIKPKRAKESFHNPYRPAIGGLAQVQYVHKLSSNTRDQQETQIFFHCAYIRKSRCCRSKWVKPVIP